MKNFGKKNIIFRRLLIFAIALFMWSSAVSIGNVTSGEFMSSSTVSMVSDTTVVSVPSGAPPPVVDGIINPGEYTDALYVPLTGPWPPEAPFPPSLVDCYVYWDTQYLWIAVDEPVPNWGTASGDNFIEFMWDADPSSSSGFLNAWVLWDNGWWSYVKCPKWGCWGTASDPFPGTSWWAVGTATEFKFDYTLYGTSYGDTIKLIVDTSEDAHLFPPFGDCQVWPANPTYYPCENPSSVPTWGTIVLDGNQPPTADAGGPYSGLVGESILLDGSGSSDLDGTIVSYEWDLDDDGVYDDATGSTTTKSWSSDGTYTISLKVTDDGGLTDTDDSTVNIGDHAVDGIISPDEYSGGMAVELVGDLDPTLTIDAYIDWDAQYLYVGVDEPVPDYIEFAFDAGPHRDYWDVFTLFASGSTGHQKCLKTSGGWSGDSYVVDAFSDTATEFKVDYTDFGIALGDTIKMCIERGNTLAFWPEGGIIWQAPGRRPDPLTWGDVTLGDAPPNIPPVADANGPYEDDNCDYTINFDGSGSNDPDGFIVSYDWDFGDGTGWHNDLGATPPYTYSNSGEYTVTLRVTDNDGLTDTDTSTAKVYGVVANANGPYSSVDGSSIQFDSSGSTSCCGDTLLYSWDFDDGETSTMENPLHTYTSVGVYTVTLTVEGSISHCTDDDTATVEVTSTVTSDANGPYEGVVGIPIDFTGSASGGVSPYTFEWDLDNDGDYDDATGPSASKSWSTTGTYTIGLKVTDNIGTTDTDTAQVSITSHAPNKPSKPSGPTSGKAGTEYEYTSSTTDPDGDQVYYWFDWDDGNNSGWIGPLASGATGSAKHTWTSQGNYQIKVKAKDTHGVESPWSDPKSISMPKSKQITNSLFIQFLEKLMNKFPLLARLLQLPVFEKLLGL